MTKTSVDAKNNFSVALGLTDYGNPILYTITSVTIILHLNKLMTLPWRIGYIMGVIISLVFGFAIPTVKLLVGLGRIKFSLPVNLVCYVNSGILMSGLMLFRNIMMISLPVFIAVIAASTVFLTLIYIKTRKFNSVAVLIGAVGYLLIYVSLISKAISLSRLLPVILYGIAIALYLMLIGIGIKADLKDARVHWVIELSNICCQGCVAIGTVLLFA